MITFVLAVALLILGYLFYGKLTVRTFGPDQRPTPAEERSDGVDYVPMGKRRVFLVQLLNIAGLGPIFGALNGALFGPVVYLWIVFGTILGGGVHDYLCGMMSMRHGGASISEVVGVYQGNAVKNLMRVFSVVLLLMVGVVFSKGPAGLLALLTPEALNEQVWLWIILAYYFIATFVPIDRVIGKIYPLFGICLLVMAAGVGGSLLLSGRYEMPELWNHFENQHAAGIPVFPYMFITVACGAISGFHATQSPMMARCCTREEHGQQVFYGAMVAEGIIALVWAAAGVSCYESSRALLDAGAGVNAVVYEICSTTMGKLGGILALLGVVVCPITSGDTAYRSARLTLADWFRLDQKDWKKRLLLTVPLLGVGALVCHVDYQVIWRYFSWSNQMLATLVLWTGSVYLVKHGKCHWLSTIPALFMSVVTVAYFVEAPECLGGLLQNAEGFPVELAALGAGLAAAVGFYLLFRRMSRRDPLPVSG